MKLHDKPIDVVLMWHMHQPQYENLVSKDFYLPWTYLHCIKDYADMAFALEQNIKARAVVNFSAVLLQQIDEYRLQLSDYFSSGTLPRDALLALLAADKAPADETLRRRLIEQCLRANQKNLIERFPVYQCLCNIAQKVLSNRLPLSYLTDQYLFDLVTWYHIAWMGESIRLHDEQFAALIEINSEFSRQDRCQLLTIIFNIIDSLTGRYRTLYEAGRVELSFTPLAHPILPLLIDFDSAIQSHAETEIPALNYPDGKARSRLHIEQGLHVFEQHFGILPTGCWPAEGAVSIETLRLLDDYHLQWAASGSGVLNKTLHRYQQRHHVQQAFRFDGCKIACFFRDDRLSDFIGFTYHDWNANDAVSHLISEIEQLHDKNPNEKLVVSIILDGENCWEYYHHNGYYFLEALYAYLADHSLIHLTTFSESLARHQEQPQLPSVVPGSWVYGDFSTWIGDGEKNRGWELLIQAKQAYDRVIDSLPDSAQKLAAEQLSICESSDWFWWLGDYNAAESVHDFDTLFRLHLRNLYQRLSLTPPADLDQPISAGNSSNESPENDGVMRRGDRS